MMLHKPRPSFDLAPWLAEQEARAATGGYEVGFYGTPDSFAREAEARLRLRARELFGNPGPDPAALLERTSEIERRRQQRRADARAADLPRNAVAALQAGLAATSSIPRAASSLAMSCALGGFAHGGLGWRGWAILSLVAALAIVNLRVVPVVLAFIRDFARAAAAALAERRADGADARQHVTLLAQCEAQEERRYQIDRWLAEHLDLLMAVYQRHKDLAARAAASIEEEPWPLKS